MELVSIDEHVGNLGVHDPLCEAFGGPIVSTSANASGRPPARSALQTRLRCPGVDLILSGATGGLTRPTPIRDALSGEVHRPG